MSGNNDKTAQLSPGKMQIVMWEGKAFAYFGKLAERKPDADFKGAWEGFCKENPLPEPLSLADFDPEAQMAATRAAAEEIFNDSR